MDENKPDPASASAEAWRHCANEWADMAINGLQWLRNIDSGVSSVKDALADMEKSLRHCREVNELSDARQTSAPADSAALPLTAATLIEDKHKAERELLAILSAFCRRTGLELRGVELDTLHLRGLQPSDGGSYRVIAVRVDARLPS